jgi:DNA-binding NarL/FixJ family response regulator/TolA-binding protein
MPAFDKIQILLADEDALRRDGLAAVLHGTAQYEVIAQCPDGETALDAIRRLLPDVAVVDLNLPGLHGIELVRRVRSEALGTKIVILSGTTDDDIIREVVRAGGDAYLLNNGPARHLIDAIAYVRDGGQYFSPQLRRDGLDRRLLEEPTRPITEQPAPARDTRNPASRDDSRYGRSKRPASRTARHTADPQHLRERLRDEAEGENLEERDYQILSMMADGIRPILDRLDEIDGRVGEMETGETPVPNNVRGWLSTEMADTFEGSRGAGRGMAVGKSVSELEARLPQLIEEAVSNRFHNMASKLQAEIEETHVRTLETFVKNIQVKLVQRVSALETDMSKQAEAMHQLREYSQRTEDNLSRLITGVDKLAQELPKRLAAAVPESPALAAPDPVPVRRRKSQGFSPKYFWVAVAALVVLGIGVWKSPAIWSGKSVDASPAAANVPAAAESVSSKVAVPAAGADSRTKLQAAREYSDRKDYAMAEDLYKQVLKTEPNNVDAMKALASVLYREDKIEESASVLDRLPKN